MISCRRRMAARNCFAVMKWTNDGNRLSVHHLKHIVEPKKDFDMYNTGDIGLAVYPGYPGQWAFVILCVGETKAEMQSWLSDYIMNFEETDVPKSHKKRKQGTQPKSLSDKMNSEDTDVQSKKKGNQGKKSNQEMGEAADWLNRRNRDSAVAQDDSRTTSETQQSCTPPTSASTLHVTPAQKNEPEQAESRHVPSANKEKYNQTEGRRVTPAQKNEPEQAESRHVPSANKEKCDQTEARRVTPAKTQKYNQTEGRRVTPAKKQKCDQTESRQVTPAKKQKCDQTEGRQVTPAKRQKCVQTEGRRVTPAKKQKCDQTGDRQVTPAKKKECEHTEEIVYLKEEIYKLKRRVRKLEDKEKKVEDKGNDGCSSEALTKLVEMERNPFAAAKTLLGSLFTQQELLSHSVSGKAPNSKTPAKPKFDSRKYGIFDNIMREKFSTLKSKDITAKVQGVQKGIQRENSKNETVVIQV